MVEEVKKIVVLEIVTKAENAIKALNVYRADLNKTKRAMKELVASGMTLGQAQAELSGKLGLASGAMEKTYSDSDLLKQAHTELSSETTKLGTSTAKTARIMERIFAAAIIGVVLNAMRRLINAMKEAVEAGAELSRSFLNIAVSTRALQRVGMDTTVQEWTDFANVLNETFTQFSQVDINKGVTQLLDLGRVAKLSAEQIRELAAATAILATKEGLTFTEAVEALSQPIGTGRTHSLRKLVEAMKETSVAQEAINRGFAESEDEVDEYIRAITVLAIMQERVAEVGDDASLIMEHLSGVYGAQTKEIENLNAVIGKNLLPLSVKLREMWVGALEAISENLVKFQRGLIVANTYIIVGLRVVGEAFKNFGAVVAGTYDLSAGKVEMFQEVFTDMVNMINPDFWGNTAEDVEKLGTAAEQAAPGLETLAEKFQDAFAKIREMFIDMGQSIARENLKWQTTVLHNSIKFALKLEQLYAKLQFDIGKVNRSFNDKIAEANDDYRDNEIEAEEDYQEKLRRLREQFLFDLEDALHERDARQIMRLIRQYNLRKTQLERERELEKEENKRSLEDQLEDIERQRAARLRELQLEYEFRRAQMVQQEAVEAALRAQRHALRIAEIKQRVKERFAAFLRELQDQGELTAKEAAVIAQAFHQFFGPGGAVEGSINYLIGMLQGAAAAVIQAIQRIRAAISGLRSVRPTTMPNAPADPTHGPFAKGGTLYADTPTTVTFGEAGPEVAHFIPLNRSSRNLGEGLGGSESSRNDRIELMVRMQDGLIAEIIDTTLDQTATVVLNVERASL